MVGWGFLGAAVGRRLSEDGAVVTGLTRSETARVQDARRRGIRVVIGDAADRDTVRRCTDGVDHVVFAAGGLDPPTAAQRPLEDALSTLSPLICTLEAMRRLDHVSFTYISSGGAVYGNPAHTIAAETDLPNPISPYGASRLAAESYSRMYATTFGITTQIVRCSNVYGPGQPYGRPQGAVAVFLNRIAAGHAISIFGDGTSVRDYVHIDDVASAMSQLIALRFDCNVVNIGSGFGHTVIELVDVVAETVGRAPVLEFVPGRPHDVAAIVLDISKLRSFIPFNPVALDVGVRATWQAISTGVRRLDAASLP